MRSNISIIHNCYGCGVCTAACPKGIISLTLNKDGFYEPYITDFAKCIDCGICLDVCAFFHEDRALKNPSIDCWAAWSDDASVRQKCSSGGIGFEIGKQLIEKGYHAIGCRYDAIEQRAEHFIASSVNEFVQSIGSKYIQSFTEEAFRKVKRKGQKYLITGTPCQIDSFRRMLQKFRCEENFILMDFYCHCVPSMWAWKAYLKTLEPKLGKITYASWRNKFDYGWHDSWLMGMDGDKVSQPIDWHDSYNMLMRGKKTFLMSRMSQGDLFYKFFLGDLCLGPQCQKNCKYKNDHSSADIRIGDLWGDTYKYDEKGVSALVSFTDKGKQIIEELIGVTLIPHSYDIVSEGQMKHNAKPSRQYKMVMWLLRHHIYLSSRLWNVVLTVESLPFRIVNKLIRIAKK